MMYWIRDAKWKNWRALLLMRATSILLNVAAVFFDDNFRMGVTNCVKLPYENIRVLRKVFSNFLFIFPLFELK